MSAAGRVSKRPADALEPDDSVTDLKKARLENQVAEAFLSICPRTILESIATEDESVGELEDLRNKVAMLVVHVIKNQPAIDAIPGMQSRIAEMAKLEKDLGNKTKECRHSKRLAERTALELADSNTKINVLEAEVLSLQTRLAVEVEEATKYETQWMKARQDVTIELTKRETADKQLARYLNGTKAENITFPANSNANTVGTSIKSRGLRDKQVTHLIFLFDNVDKKFKLVSTPTMMTSELPAWNQFQIDTKKLAAPNRKAIKYTGIFVLDSKPLRARKTRAFREWVAGHRISLTPVAAPMIESYLCDPRWREDASAEFDNVMPRTDA